MSIPIAIKGTGAVSPAGWGVPAMANALSSGAVLPPSGMERARGDDVVLTKVLRVPADAAAMPKGARLRRASPITKFAAAAMIEALGPERMAAIASQESRVGVIFTLMNGCVNYSNRFFGEVLSDPAFASPILFPETVFNAPSSHLSALLGSHSANDTLIGDGTGFFTGVDLAVEWISRGDVDGCVVVAAEELDWLSAEALGYYTSDCIPAEGAGAIYLEPGTGPVRLLKLPEPVPYSAMTRGEAAHAIRKSLRPENDAHTLLVDGLCGSPGIDHAEHAAWHDWRGPRISPRRTLGEGLGVSAAWQCVAAVHALTAGVARQAVITAVGGNQQAAGLLISLQ